MDRRRSASLLALAIAMALADPARADVVISQVYGGGGNAGAPLRSDFIELHNNGTAPVDLAGWSVHYASASGTSWQRTGLTGTIAAGGYYLVKQADGTNTGATALPAPDATGSIPMSGTAGKVALTSGSGGLSGSCPTGLVDFVGYGGANCFEGGAPAGALSNTSAALRLEGGCTDSNDNRADFAIATPAPRNGASTVRTCSPGQPGEPELPITAIGTIQGAGARSPLEGRLVATRGIVTARKANGFFIQSAEIDTDADTATSEGLFVFTRSAPPAAAVPGRRVIVRGTVTEFVPSQDPGQAPVTQLAGTVSVAADGDAAHALPAAVELHAEFPAASGAVDQLERIEGMRVHVPRFTVTAPTDGTTNEREATGAGNGVFHGVVAGVARPFREPGIQAPDAVPGGGSTPPIPRWDFNPELLAVDSDAIGAPALDVATGTELAGLTGPLDYGFRRYTILPETAPAVGPQRAPDAAAVPHADAFTVAAYNLERFFDEVNDPAIGEPVLTASAFERRLAKASLGIRETLHLPDILGVIEVENLDVLQRLADRINADAVAAGRPDPRYSGHLHEGNDVGGIDVGFLVKTGAVAGDTPRIAVHRVMQVDKDMQWTQPDGTRDTLNDRPPLALDATVHYADGRAFPVSVVLVHQRSLNGAETDDASGERVRGKRQRQAEFLAAYLDARQDTDPELRLVVLGDFNAFEFNDGLADTMGTVTGRPSADAQTAVLGDGADLVDPDLVNLGALEPAHERYSYVFGGNAQTLDHVLVNEAMVVATRDITLDHARINADFPEAQRSDAGSPARLSDHDPVLAAFVPRRRADLVLRATAPATSVGTGGTLAFDVHVRNEGPEQADRPGVGFEIDAALPALQVLAPAGWDCDAPQLEAARTFVTCQTEALLHGHEAVFTLRAPADAALFGRRLQLAAAVDAESLDPVRDNNTGTAALEVISVAGLGVALDGPTHPLRAHEQARLRITLEADGPHLAVAPVLTLWSEHPADVAGITAPAGWSCASAPANGAVHLTCHAASHAPGAATEFELVLGMPRLSRSELMTVHARIYAAGTDPDASDDRAAHTMRLVPGGP